MAVIGFLATGCLLAVGSKVYIKQFGNEEVIKAPFTKLVGIFVMTAGGFRLGEASNYLE